MTYTQVSRPHPFLPGEELTDDDNPQSSVVIDFSPEAQTAKDGALITPTGDSLVVDFDPSAEEGKPPADAAEHDANLAEYLSETEKARIVNDVIRWMEADAESRTDWFQRLAKGLEVLGLTPDSADLGALKLAKNVSHPLLVEAAVQFQARAIAELVPAGGPAKSQVLGQLTEEKEQSAQRVADFLNYSLMQQDQDYFNQTDRMFFVLSYEGSQFKKIYRDPLLRRPVSRWVKAEAFLVPYDTASLETAPRYTHIYPLEHNDLLKMQRSGFFCKDAAVGKASTRPQDLMSSGSKEIKDRAEGQTPPSLLDDYPHTMLECHCLLDLEGFEDEDEAGEATDIALPYIVHVEYDSRKLLGVYRNWKEDDADKNKRVWFVHYPFVPGDGFYSYGNLHLAGGLAAGCTGALRILLAGSLFASIPGGFKTKEGKKAVGQTELEPGVFKDIDATWDEISKAFYTPNFRDPAESLFKALGLMTEAGQRLFSTQETMVGDASNTGPVGTTVALIEEGKKVFSGIHKRLHDAQGCELKLLKELHSEWMPPEGYPYDVPGENRQVFAEDFGPHSDIVPVSDPNIFSTTQRVAVGQALAQRADAKPQLYDARKIESRLLEAMKVPDYEELLIDPRKIQRCDPVTENALINVGHPVKVWPDQDHRAHGVVHRSLLMQLQAEAEQNPLAQSHIAIVLAHMAEHDAYAARIQIAQQLGIELPPMDLSAAPGEPVTPEVPPDYEAMIAQKAAMMLAQSEQPQSPEEGAAQQEALAEKEKALQQQEAELQKQAQALQQAGQKVQDETRQLEKLRAEVERKALKADFDNREAALRGEIATLQAKRDHEKIAADTQRKVGDAVSRIEALLQTAAQPSPQGKPTPEGAPAGAAPKGKK